MAELLMFIFLLKKREISENVLGSVHFRDEEDVKGAISYFDGKVFNSNTFTVSWAKCRCITSRCALNKDH